MSPVLGFSLLNFNFIPVKFSGFLCHVFLFFSIQACHYVVFIKQKYIIIYFILFICLTYFFSDRTSHGVGDDHIAVFIVSS